MLDYILDYIMLCYVILYYVILYHIILYYKDIQGIRIICISGFSIPISPTIDGCL